MDPRDRVIVALDAAQLEDARALAGRLAGVVRWLKVGSALYTAAGPAAVAALVPRFRVFLDLKFHDIPTQVAGAVDAAMRLGVDLCNVHALGGRAMLRAAAEAAAPLRAGRRPATVIAVTLLTSLDAAAMEEAAIAGTPAETALRLAKLAQVSGLGGVVASPRDAGEIRTACGRDFLIVCPGIRAAGGAGNDQRRTLSPGDAIRAGADMLVVGRPITAAPDPLRAAEEILDEIGGV
jgi:orotidine-5'-phosphate decarboxylase